MRQKMLYIAGLIITIYLNIMYAWEAGRLFLAGFLVLPFLCELSAWYAAAGIQAEMFCENTLLSEGENVRIFVRIKSSRAFLPATVKTILTVSGQDGVLKREALVLSTEETEKSVEMKAEVPGILRITAKKIIVQDAVGIGSIWKSWKRFSEVTVMPEVIPVTMTISENIRSFAIDSDEFSKTKSGDDVSEVFDLREYRPGDSMHRVHWKLSARQEKLWVKEYSFPIGASIVLFAEDIEDGNKIKQADFLRGFVSVSRSLLENGCIHYAVWTGRADHFPKRFLVASEEVYYEMAGAFLKDSADGFGEQIEEQYLNEFPERYCCGLVWETNGVLRKEEETLFQVKRDEDLRSKLKDVLIEV